MKFKAITAAIALMALCGLNMSAQRPQRADKSAKCTNTEVACPYGAQCDTAACYGPYSEIFAGLNLTADQQNALKAIKPQRPAKQAREARAQAADSVRRAVRAERQQQRRDYLDKVKQVLTPEQYVTFLEQIVVETPAGPAPGRPQGMTQMRRGDKQAQLHANHGRRFDKQSRQKKHDRQAQSTEAQTR